MPSIIAHCYCADKALANSNTDQLRKVIRKKENMYHLGAQGPDSFLFYHNIPTQSQKDAKDVRLYAKKIHEHNINGSFTEMLKKSKEDNDEDLIAYVAGFLLHNCLDSCAHPYVCYSTGSKDKNVGYSHLLFEGQIELGILQLFNIDLKQYRPVKLIRHTAKQRAKVANLLLQVLRNAHNCDATFQQVYYSLKDFSTIEKILDDVKKNKYPLLSKIENLAGKPGIATSMMTPYEYDDKLDAMNYRHDKWHDPCDENNIFTTSFEDMFNEAVERGKALLDLYQKFIFENGSMDDVLNAINNRSFISGYSYEKEMCFFKKDQL